MFYLSIYKQRQLHVASEQAERAVLWLHCSTLTIQINWDEDIHSPSDQSGVCLSCMSSTRGTKVASEGIISRLPSGNRDMSSRIWILCSASCSSRINRSSCMSGTVPFLQTNYQFCGQKQQLKLFIALFDINFNSQLYQNGQYLCIRI